MVHIKRQVKNYTSVQPKLLQAKELLKISNQITSIKTQEQCGEWLLQFYKWHQENKLFINQKSRSIESNRMWYTHKNLHTAFSLIINAIPDMFAYLNDNEIPYTTHKIGKLFYSLKRETNLA